MAATGRLHRGAVSVPVGILKPGTSYTYKAYSDSACTAELAKVGFSTGRNLPDLFVPNIWNTGATLRLGGQPGRWYHKQAGAPASTCAAGGTGPALFNLSGLTPGTEYNWKAYLDSACTMELASRRFRTTGTRPLLTASGVADTKAVLTLANHAGAWWYRQESPAPAGACTPGGTDASSVTLTGLTRNTSYTGTAYTDSACTTALASVTFTTQAAPPVLTIGRLFDSAGNPRDDAVNLRLGTYAGAWRYKQTAPADPGAPCVGVAQGQVASLSPLTPGTRYTVTAYLNAGGCSAAGELARVTFTAGAPPGGDGDDAPTSPGTPPGGDAELRVSVADTQTFLELTNYADPWWYRQDAPAPGSACTPGGTGAGSVPLSGLTPNTAYTITAYADDTCTSTNELARVTFTAGAPPAGPVEVLLRLALNRVLEGLQLTLTVTLSAPPGQVVTVPVVATPGTASPDDYAVWPPRVTFGPGETVQTVHVSALADARWDEPDETVRLAVGADLPAQVTAGPQAAIEVTIENRTRRTAAVQAWTARFGRTAATHVTDAIGDRLRAPPAQASHLTLGGYRLPLGRRDGTQAVPSTGQPVGAARRGRPAPAPQPAPARGEGGSRRSGVGEEAASAGALLEGLAGILGLGPGNAAPGADAAPDTPWAAPPDPRLGQSQRLRLPAFRLRDVVRGSSFRLALGGEQADASYPSLTAWGRVAGTTFDGQDGARAVNGDVLTGTVGLDGTWGRWLGGLAVAHSRGDGTYTMPLADDGRDEGALEQTLTSLHPYVRYAVTDRLAVWGLVGYGWGELDLTLDTGATRETDTQVLMGAVGGRGLLLAPAATGGVQLATRTDAMFTRTRTDAAPNLDATAADAHRVRLILEGSRGYTWADGQTVTPTVELGLRHDWGDAETGFGLEVGGRVSYAHPGLGLTVDGAVRGLLAHEDTAYDEWGASGTVRVAPEATGHGLSLTLAPAWGATASGVEGLWTRQTTAGLAPHAPPAPRRGRLLADVGYGVALFDTGLLTPYAGTVLTDGAARTYRLGARWAGRTGWQVHLEGARQDPADRQPGNQGVQVQATWGF